MARTTLTKTAATGKYPTAGVVLTMAIWDATNGNQFVSTGKDIIVVWNTDTISHTYTIHSVADDKNRTGDITTQSIAASAHHIIGPLPSDSWAQTGGFITVDASDATVKFGVLQLP
jgi:hypothetical protein